MSRVLLGDNLQILKGLPDNYIDLIYIDPPFGTGNVQRVTSYIHDSLGDFSDISKGSEYLAKLEQRLIHMRRVLSDRGSIYVHLDWHYVHYVKVMLDQIFGQSNFLGEIIWAYDYGGRPKDRWPKKHDTLLWYSKTNKWIFNYDEIERISYMAPELVGPEKAAIGKLPTDVWWMTIVPTNSRECTGYPTQKPMKLLERIISASSLPNSIVADFYCGSGTTGVVAKNLGREYLLVDASEFAIETTNFRIERGL